MYGTHNLIVAADNGGRADRLRDTKIRQLRHTRIGDQDIVRLDVPMYDLILVCQTERRSDLTRNADRFLVIQPAFFLNILAERLALHQFHDDEMDITLFPHVIDTHDIRVCQSGRCL